MSDLINLLIIPHNQGSAFYLPGIPKYEILNAALFPWNSHKPIWTQSIIYNIK